MSGPDSVVHVLWSGRVGGIERLVVDLASAQVQCGADVRIAFGQAEGPFATLAECRGPSVVDLGLRSGHDLSPDRSEGQLTFLQRAP